ncbi:MAG: DUF4097 family beta strand repeat-containing protein [Acidobacteriaceae bacterium]
MGMPPRTPPPPYPPSRAQWKAQRAQWKMQARMQRAAYRASLRGPVRGSILGPMFLILIGVLALLMTMHRIDVNYFWSWYGHWWPLILIGAGVLLALESLMWSSSSRIRLGGGVVFLVLLLVLVGIAASHNHVNWQSVGEQIQFGNDVNLAQMFGNKHQAREQIDHALPSGATVIVQNAHGDVTIATGAGDQMHLTLNKTVYTSSNRDAKRELSALEPLITSSGSVVTVHMPSSDSHVADMNLVLPADNAVQVKADHGNVTVSGRKGAVTVNCNQGDVDLTGIVGAVQVAMRNGDFTGRNVQGDVSLNGRMNDVTLSQVSGSSTLTGDFFGDVHLDNLTGPVHFHSSRTDIQVARLEGAATLDDGDLTIDKALGPVSVSTRAMDVSLRHIQGETRVNNSNGSIGLRAVGPVAAIDIKNRNGSVDVTVPENAKLTVQAVSVDGEITSDFKLAQSSANDRVTASGQVGGGGPLLNILAEKGDINLHKAGANNGQ